MKSKSHPGRIRWVVLEKYGWIKAWDHRGHYRMGKQEMTNNTIWSRSHSLVQDTHSRSSLISKFVEYAEGETFTAYQELTLKSTLLTIIDKIAELAKHKDAVIKSDESKWVAFEGAGVLVIVSDEDKRDEDYAADLPTISSEEKATDLSKPKVGVFGITIVGSRKVLAHLMGCIKDIYHSERFARIKWWYEEHARATYKTIYIDNPNTVLRPEFYPGIGNPEAYISEYLASDASVLLLAGPPGTGKTTLLRHMVYHHNLSASVVYDEKLMERDTIFQSFLFDKREDILLVEDADVILTTRDLDNNKLMSRFLNISDGLIKLPNKKLVFTTNVTDFSKVDEALMRHGRCFDVLQTHALRSDEAVAAARAAGLPLPMENREFTVAELFNQGGKKLQRRVGFRR